METQERPKISRYATTEYNRYKRLESAAKDVYARARAYKLSHDTILEALSLRVHNTEDNKRLTAYYRGKLSGILDMLFHGHYQELEWRIFYNGQLVKSEDIPEGEWSKTEGDKSQFVYKSDPGRVF